MKHLVPFMLIALCLFIGTATNAQDVNPEVTRYAKMFDLNEQQVAALTAIYAETADQEVALKDKIATLRSKSAEVRNSPEESTKWRNDMEAAANERRTIRKDREEKMVELFNDEQKNTYDKWKDGSLNREELLKKMQK